MHQVDDIPRSQWSDFRWLDTDGWMTGKRSVLCKDLRVSSERSVMMTSSDLVD